MKRAHWISMLLLVVAMLITFSAGSAWAGVPCLLGLCCGDTTGPPGGLDVPCDCGDTVTTNTVLKASDPVTRKVCGPPAALFVAGGVTLDMTSPSVHIRCAGKEDTVGIELIGDDVTIDGGSSIIDGCDVGVFGFTSRSTIQLVFVRNGGDDGIELIGDDNVLVRNLCHNNGSEGIHVFGDRNRLDRNYCRANGGHGIEVEGANNHLTHNLGYNNGEHGIFAPDPTNTTDFRNYGAYNGLEPQCVIGGSNGRYC